MNRITVLFTFLLCFTVSSQLKAQQEDPLRQVAIQIGLDAHQKYAIAAIAKQTAEAQQASAVAKQTEAINFGSNYPGQTMPLALAETIVTAVKAMNAADQMWVPTTVRGTWSRNGHVHYSPAFCSAYFLERAGQDIEYDYSVQPPVEVSVVTHFAFNDTTWGTPIFIHAHGYLGYASIQFEEADSDSDFVTATYQDSINSSNKAIMGFDFCLDEFPVVQAKYLAAQQAYQDVINQWVLEYGPPSGGGGGGGGTPPPPGAP